jgi:anti-sigma factor (TIGR02949 family)
MKDCNDDSATIQLYLNKELSGQELENFHAHLEECETCLIELEAEAELSALLHRSRPLYRAPAPLANELCKSCKLQSHPLQPPGMHLSGAEVSRRFWRCHSRLLVVAVTVGCR